MFSEISKIGSWLDSHSISYICQSYEMWQTNVLVDCCIIGYWFVVFLILFILCSLILMSDKTIRIFELISKKLLLISLLTWLLGTIIYIVGFYQPEMHWLAVIPRAVISSFKMFVVSNELARVHEDLRDDSLYMIAFSVIHFAAAFITFLFIFKMIGYKMKSSWKIFRHKWLHVDDKMVHLFWGVNGASCLLAKDIRKNAQHQDDIIIFVDIDDECEDNTQKKPSLSTITNTITLSNKEIARLEEVGALIDHCYNGPASLNFKEDKETEKKDVFGALNLKGIGKIVNKCMQCNYYFLSDDEGKNIAGALNLLQDTQLKQRKNSKDKDVIYVHARKDANNEVFDHYSQYEETEQKMKLRVVDSAYLSVLCLKQDGNSLPVNCVESKKGLVDSPFTAMVVGFGGTGQEAFKFLYEFSAFVGTNDKRNPFKCYAIDEQMDKIEGVIKAKMPKITESKELILMKESVNSEKFWSFVSTNINDLNYIVITLNNDTIGLTLAVNLFKYALQHRDENAPKLKIRIRCYETCNETRMRKVVDKLNSSIGNREIDIQTFGEEENIYSCDTILLEKLLKEARTYHWVYENKKEDNADVQWKKDFVKDGDVTAIDKEIKKAKSKGKTLSRYHAIYDINRKIGQDVANTLHKKTKLKLLDLVGNDEKTIKRLKHFYDIVNTRDHKNNKIKYQCTPEEEELLINIAKIEHLRWEASHKLIGFTYAAERSLVKKHHENMVDWKKLSEETQSYDCNVVDTTIKLAYEEANKMKK